MKKMRSRHGGPQRWGIWTVLLVLFLAACGGAPADVQSGPGTPAPLRPPEDVARDFLRAWNAEDYAAMYALVSPQTRARYALADFQGRYQELDDIAGVEAVISDIGAVTLQGTTAAVTYDVRLETMVFGTIEDPGRVLRLVQTPDGWQVAWSTMDIFDGLAAGAQLTVRSNRPARGNIYDRNGNLLVEEGGTKIVLYGAQEDMNVQRCLDLLSDLFQQPRGQLAAQFAVYAPETIFYLGEVDPDVYDQHAQDLANFCGSSFDNERALERQTRRYVGQGALAHVVGYIGLIPQSELDRWLARGYTSDDLIGRAGVELAYEEVLHGRAERLLQIVEPGGVVLRELGGATGAPSQPVTLTLDRDLQLAVARALFDAYSYAVPNWASRSPGAAAVVLDVNSGAVLALASYPTFDPGIFNPDSYHPAIGDVIASLTADPRQPMFNRAVQGQYAPGSVFKIVTTAAAAAENLIGPDELFNCELEWRGAQYGDTLPVRYDWRYVDEMDPAGPIRIDQALTSSCDPFFYQMGALLYRRGPNVLADYARRMGLGSPTGLDVYTNEAAGNLAAPPGGADEAINNAIGQGNVQVSPIQMARLVAGIANGGTLYRPYLVERVGGVGGTEVTYQAQPTVVGEMGLSPQVIDIVRRGMCAVTTDRTFGTAWFVFDDAAYTVCGKTGTAQTDREPNAWFVAYAPADAPQVAVVVMVQYSREGSEVAAPIVRRILDAYFDQPYADFPDWWTEDYVPLQIATGGTGGG
jgi:penicillin-binding protein 2